VPETRHRNSPCPQRANPSTQALTSTFRFSCPPQSLPAAVMHDRAVAQFSWVWETVTMAKRSLRVLKRVSNVASLGVCEFCKTQFSADPRQLGQAGVQQQFNAHKCDARQAPPIAKETAKAAL
jgi:hypothetical protein